MLFVYSKAFSLHKLKKKVSLLYAKFKNNCNSFPIIRKRLIEAYPNKFESVYNIYKRAEAVKQMVKDYIQKYEVDFDEKIVLISHENFLKVYTGKWEDGQINEDMKDPKCSLKYSWSDDETVRLTSLRFWMFLIIL